MKLNSWIRDVRQAVYGVLLLIAISVGSLVNAADQCQIAYSFVRSGGGGLAVIQMDAATGQFVDERILLEAEECNRPEKIRYDSKRLCYVMTNETAKEAGPHLYIVSQQQGVLPKAVSLPEVPDEVRLHDGCALLTCDGDLLVQVDLDSGELKRKWNTGKIVDPPANGPQDIRFLGTEDTVVVSFQKDSRKGKKKGSRIIAFQWPKMTVIADSRLPRNRPDLHIKGNKQATGPSPEIVHLSVTSNRIFATLDLYGAVAIGELDKFLEGKDVAWKYLSTAADGSWGNSFPDRMSVFNYAGNEVALVANSGVDGGTALFDLSKKSVIWRTASPAGMETPVYVPNLQRAYTVCSGKQKARARRDTEKTFLPQRGVFAFELAKRAPDGSHFSKLPTDKFMFRVALVGPVSKPWIVLAGGLGSPDTLMVLDPRTGKFVDERPAAGALMRFEQG